jgi:hypothetical protein
MQKPIDLWLWIVGIVAGIIMWLIPKTPFSIIVSLSIIFILLCHPVWNFWWIEKTRFRRVVACFVLAVCISIVGVYSWPVSASFVFFQPTFLSVEPPQQWMFAPRLRGSEPLYRVDISWNDKAKPFTADRWKMWMYDEIDPEPRETATFLKMFPWVTPDIEHEWYTIDIMPGRNGKPHSQELRIEKVGALWKIATRVTEVGSKKILLECRDNGFPEGLGFDSKISECWPGFPKKD